jgi:ATP-dependent Clp protease ATP-binding subunit ClpC
MIQEYVQKSTKKVLITIEIAVSELMAQKQNVLSPEFILLALVSQQDAEAVKIIKQTAPDPVNAVVQIKAQIINQTKQTSPVEANQIVSSQELVNLFSAADGEAKNLGDEYISTGALFIAMFDPTVGQIKECLQEVGIEREQAIKALKEIRGGRTISSQDAETEADVLAKYTRDLTDLARKGELDPVIGREEEITQVIQTLSRRKKNNPVLIGEAGVGKTVIVESLAQRIVAADVPDTLLNKSILSLDMGEIIAGAKMRGEFEERLQAIRDAVIQAKGKIILFIDELHTVVDAGAGASAWMHRVLSNLRLLRAPYR